MNIDIDKLTTIELKALVYDLMARVESDQNSVRELNLRIRKSMENDMKKQELPPIKEITDDKG